MPSKSSSDGWAVDAGSTHEEHSASATCIDTSRNVGGTSTLLMKRLERHKRRILAMALPQQMMADDFTQYTEFDEGAVRSSTGTTVLRSFASAPQLLRSLSIATEDYFVVSGRPGVVWDSTLLARVEREIDAVEALGVPWFCLTADGQNLNEDTFFAAHFDYEPTLTPNRGRLIIVQTVATLVVVKASSYRALGLRRAVRNDIASYINDLIILAYGRKFASYFTSYLFPCVAEHRSLVYSPLNDRLVALNVASYLEPQDAETFFPPHIRRDHLFHDWLEEVQARELTDYQFSFVVRTLFKRKYLLERCLISIEYLRSSLGFEAEIVLATDLHTDEFEEFFAKLQSNFPKIRFIVADGRSEHGCSRVRNLVAGLKATTGDRVCIIDDDDYYTPQAVKFFKRASTFGIEEIIIFDTQIILEQWSHGGIKPHREILAYQQLFAAREWSTTLKGTNSIPLCGVIYPGGFVRQIIASYAFDFDYSEDFIFHIHCFTHPRRPAIRIEDGIGAYQSHRDRDDNVSTTKDRRKWTTDTGNGLYQLLFEQGRTFDVMSSGTARSVDFERLLAEATAAREGQEQATSRLAELVGRHASLGAKPKAGWPVPILREAGTRAQRFVIQVSAQIGSHLRAR